MEKKMSDLERAILGVLTFATYLVKCLKLNKPLKKVVIDMAEIIADKKTTEDEKMAAAITIIDALS